MTGNRKTELLRKLLDERGVEYETDDNEKYLNTLWNTADRDANPMNVLFQEPLDGIPGTIGAWTELHIGKATSEQAIDATLRNERDDSKRKLEILKAHGVEIVDAVAGGFEVYNEAIRERDEWKRKAEQAIAATLGSDASTVRFAEWLRSIADEMRHMGASTMTPHELLAFYASEVDKVADSLMFAVTLRSELTE